MSRIPSQTSKKYRFTRIEWACYGITQIKGKYYVVRDSKEGRFIDRSISCAQAKFIDSIGESPKNRKPIPVPFIPTTLNSRQARFLRQLDPTSD